MVDAALYSSDRQDWETPHALFRALDAEFPFTLDVCATPANAKCDQFYQPSDRALTKPWRQDSSWWWCNPPYGRGVKAWIAKGVDERRGIMLLPSRTDTRWFHEYLWDSWHQAPYTGIELRFLKGRLTFQGASASAPFPSMVVVIRA